MDCSHVFEFKVKRLIVVFTLFLAFLSVSSGVFAQADTAVVSADTAVTAAHVEGAHGAEHGEKKFEPTKVIMEHIADSHMWHLWGHLSVPLPVILYTPAGVEFFSSGN